MRFTSSASVALVASLAALGEASYPFHARSGKFLHHARGFNSTADDGVSSVFVIPTPAEKTPQVTPSIPLSTGAAREIDPEAAVSTQTSVEDLTLTYTLGGASTTVVTTTVQRTATNTVVVTQTPEASVTQEAVADDEPTTTISTTSTTTSIVTVYPVASSALVGGSNAAGSCNGVTVTVTEKETVTVVSAVYANRFYPRLSTNMFYRLLVLLLPMLLPPTASPMPSTRLTSPPRSRSRLLSPLLSPARLLSLPQLFQLCRRVLLTATVLSPPSGRRRLPLAS